MDDTPNKSLERVVTALGGSKQVAPQLWPDKGITEAQRLLCDCLNDDRPAKLEFAQVLFILALAKKRGIHSGIEFIADHLGYTHPQPIEPEDEAAELRRQVLEMGRQLKQALDRIETLDRPQLRSAA